MKTFLAVAATLGVLAACSDRPAEAAASRPAQEQDSTLKFEENYAAMDRPAFIESMEKKLATVNDELQTLETKVAQAGTEVKKKLKATLETLPEKQSALELKLTEFKDNVADAATEARKDLVESYLELQSIIKDALKKVVA